mmetsp:Transcript_2483/g.3551  ORF Transcript_2483/g.3551 Transcript_2483/m.3551 type:complete len:91 (-) Transcript_2483:236-508(-)
MIGIDVPPNVIDDALVASTEGYEIGDPPDAKSSVPWLTCLGRVGRNNSTAMLLEISLPGADVVPTGDTNADEDVVEGPFCEGLRVVLHEV